MELAVLGTGAAGRAIAARLAELGHHVSIGTRDPEATLARDDFAGWAGDHPAVRPATFEAAASGAEVVLLVTSGSASLDVLTRAGAENLEGKVVIDVSNPLDFSQGMPPTLFVKDTDSLAEQLQRAFPAARVVKTLNTMNNEVMVHPELLPDPGSVFVSGNDAAAKETATGLLAEFGHTDVIDLGDLSTARGAEMLLPIWVRLMGVMGTARFNFKIVR
ncbi:MAG TPA: NAD(P)-binding domain-containing protein [Nocardioides sp.]|nr:NAD(P)-binding domain-containing protein [Nocardioides sp.]